VSAPRASVTPRSSVSNAASDQSYLRPTFSSSIRKSQDVAAHEPDEDQASVCGSTFSASALPIEESRWETAAEGQARWAEFHRRSGDFLQGKEELLELLRKKKLVEELQDCTFEPQVRRASRSDMQDKGRARSSSCLYAKGLEMEASKAERLELMRKERENMEMVECKFRPETRPSRLRQSAVLEAPPAMPRTRASGSYAAAYAARRSTLGGSTARASVAPRAAVAGDDTTSVAGSGVPPVPPQLQPPQPRAEAQQRAPSEEPPLAPRSAWEAPHPSASNPAWVRGLSLAAAVAPAVSVASPQPASASPPPARGSIGRTRSPSDGVQAAVERMEDLLLGMDGRPWSELGLRAGRSG